MPLMSCDALDTLRCCWNVLPRLDVDIVHLLSIPTNYMSLLRLSTGLVQLSVVAMADWMKQVGKVP